MKTTPTGPNDSFHGRTRRRLGHLQRHRCRVQHESQRGGRRAAKDTRGAFSAAGNSPTERRRREKPGPYWLVLMNKGGFTRLLKDSRAVTITQHTCLFGNTRCFVGYAACEPTSSHQTSPPSPIHSLFLASRKGLVSVASGAGGWTRTPVGLSEGRPAGRPPETRLSGPAPAQALLHGPRGLGERE